MFALALLCAGESAGITVTLAGQIVSEGFIRWTVSVRTILPSLIIFEFSHVFPSSLSLSSVVQSLVSSVFSRPCLSLSLLVALA